MESFSKRVRNNARLRRGEIARLLLASRRNAKWSQGVVARALGYSQSDLSRWERGKKQLDIVEVANLANLYNLNLAEFSTIGMGIQQEDARTGADEFRERAIVEASRVARLKETLKQKRKERSKLGRPSSKPAGTEVSSL
jgi:transcriptional regulator with XRE-family HTH domain